jgi:hypothetical protein
MGRVIGSDMVVSLLMGYVDETLCREGNFVGSVDSLLMPASSVGFFWSPRDVAVPTY